MLNINLGLNKKIYAGSSFVGLLDELDIVDDLVLGFADILLTNTYEGIAYKLVRSSDDEEQDFYFNANGELDTASMISWLAGANGLVKQRGNQGNVNYPAYQNDKDKMPILITGGVFNIKGNYHDGTDDYLIVDDYSDIQITSQSFSIYSRAQTVTQTGYIYAKNNLDSAANQYSLKFNYGGSSIYSIMEGGIRHGSSVPLEDLNKSILDWSSDTVTLKNNSNIESDSYSGSLSNRANFRIGCRHDSGGSGVADLLKGYIKTIMIFNSTQYSNYSNFVNAGL